MLDQWNVSPIARPVKIERLGSDIIVSFDFFLVDPFKLSLRLGRDDVFR